MANGLACAEALSKVLRSWENPPPPSPALAHLPCLVAQPANHTSSASPLSMHYPFLNIHHSQGSTVTQSLSWELADNVTGSWNLIERIESSLPRRKEGVDGSSSFPIHRKLEEKADKLSLRLDPTQSGHLPRPSVEAGCQGRALVRPATNRLNTFPETL